MKLSEIEKVDSLENEIIEFKAKLNRDNFESWIKTISGFSNAKGGTIYLGVRDDLTLEGFTRDEADKERNFFNNSVNQFLVPLPQYTISFLKYIVNSKTKYVIKIIILESKLKPVYVKYKGVYSAFIRKQGYTSSASPSEIYDMVIKSKKYEFDVLPTNIKYDKDDFKKLHFCYSERTGKELNDKELEVIGFFDKDRYLKQGALLFKDDYSGEKTAISCNVFQGFNKGDDRIITSDDIKTNILDSITFSLSFIKRNMNIGMIKTDDGRIDVPAYPSRSLIEGVVNSIVHRDYYIENSQISIDIFRDRLEITSPGPLASGELINKNYDLTHIISERRNKLISEVLVRLKYMEAKSTGFDKIAMDYKEQSNKHKPFVFSDSRQFTLTLPDLTYQDGVENTFSNVNLLPSNIQNPQYSNTILNFCLNKQRSIKEICLHLNISDSTYFRRNILEPLVKEQYLICSKQGNKKVYITNKDQVF